MARMFIVYAAFTSERSALSVTSSARAFVPFGHVVVPGDAERGAVDRRLELQAVALVAVGIGDRAGERAR